MRKLASVLVAVLVSLLLVGHSWAQSDKPIQITFSGKEPGKIPIRYHQMFTELVNYRAKGKVKMTYFPRAQLGSAEEQIDKVSTNVIQMCERSTVAVAKYVKWATVNDLPFSGFSSPIVFKTWWDTTIAPAENKDLAAFNLMNLPYVAYMGSSQIFSAAGPIRRLDDFKGKVFRAKSPGIEVKWMELLGAKVTVMPFSELYNALQQHVVDLMHNPARDAIADKFYEVSKDLTVTNHKQFAYLVLVNTKFWNSLPPDIRKIIETSWAEAAYAWTAEAMEEEQTILQQLQGPPYNMKVYFPAKEDLETIRKAVMPVYEYARTTIGSDKVDLLLKHVK